MRPKSNPTVLVVALSLAGTLPAWAAAAAQGLTGAYRTLAIETMSKACIEAGAADPDIAKMPKAAVRDYCRCYAGRVADRATRAQIEAENSPERETIAEAAAKVCFDAMPDAAKN